MKQWSATGGDLQWGRQVSGGAALVQRHEHMIDTAPGELGSDPEFGIGIRRYQGATTLDVDPTSLAAVFRAQHLRDPETEDARGGFTLDGKGLAQYDAVITAKDGTVETVEAVIE